MGYLIVVGLAVMFMWLASRNYNSDELQDMWNSNKNLLIQKDKVKEFNKAVAKLYYGYAIVILIIGLPFLFFGEDSPILALSVILLLVATITMMVLFTKIEKKYKEKWAR